MRILSICFHPGNTELPYSYAVADEHGNTMTTPIADNTYLNLAEEESSDFYKATSILYLTQRSDEIDDFDLTEEQFILLESLQKAAQQLSSEVYECEEAERNETVGFKFSKHWDLIRELRTKLLLHRDMTVKTKKLYHTMGRKEFCKKFKIDTVIQFCDCNAPKKDDFQEKVDNTFAWIWR